MEKGKRNRWILCILLPLLFLVLGCYRSNSNVRSNKTAAVTKPNVIIIYSDDVGYGDISCYGGVSIQTPNIDKLAASGVRFTNAHTDASTCTPSRYSILTGQYAWRHKGTGIARGNAPLIIDTSRVTVADVMKRAGYRTAAIGKWHLGLGPDPQGPDWNGVIKPGPLELGFDECFLIPATPDRVPCVYLDNHRIAKLVPGDPITVSYNHPVGDWPTGKKDPKELWMKPSRGGDHEGTIVNGISRIGWMTGGKSALWTDSTISDVMTNRAVNFIKENKNHPFFLYFASHDVHVPRVPDRRFVGKSGMGPRGDELLELDWEVGRIVKTLDSLHISQNTMIVFSSDNGPVLDDGYQDGAVEGAEHPKIGEVTLPPHKPAGPLSGGKYSILEGGTRVPFIVNWPGHTAKGTVSDALISQVDLLASLADLTHQKIDKNTGPDSFDLLNVLLGKTQKGRSELVEQTNSSDPLGFIQGDWKYIEPSNKSHAWVEDVKDIKSGVSPHPQLYNLKNDIGEQNNLASKYPDRVNEMAKALEKLKKDGHSRPE